MTTHRHKGKVRYRTRKGRVMYRRRPMHRLRKIKKAGFFGPSRFDTMSQEEQISEQAIMAEGMRATQMHPFDVEIITRGVKEDFEADIDKTKGSRWRAFAEEDE